MVKIRPWEKIIISIISYGRKYGIIPHAAECIYCQSMLLDLALHIGSYASAVAGSVGVGDHLLAASKEKQIRVSQSRAEGQATGASQRKSRIKK